MKFTFLKWNVTPISFFSFSYNIEDQIQAITNAGEEPHARPAEPCFVCSVVSVGRGILMEQVQSLKLPGETAWLSTAELAGCQTPLSSSYCWTHSALALGAKFRQPLSYLQDHHPSTRWIDGFQRQHSLCYKIASRQESHLSWVTREAQR